MFKEKGGPLVLEEIETKMPEDGEVLVKVLACGVCHSEVIAQQSLMGTPLYDSAFPPGRSILTLGSPRIPGHEMIGNVAAVPPTEKNWKVGDRVGGPWHGGHDG